MLPSSSSLSLLEGYSLPPRPTCNLISNSHGWSHDCDWGEETQTSSNTKVYQFCWQSECMLLIDNWSCFFIFLGCSDYIRFNRWSPNNLLSKVVNLSVANSEQFVLSSSRDKCSVISGHFFDYNGFHGEWKSIHDQIFGFHQLKLQVQHWFFSLIFIPFCDIYTVIRHFPELSI